MAQYTLTYSEGTKGWPSFYSFIPEWICGSNNYLYTFSQGQMWRHNTNINRSNFYGVQYSSSVTTILNTSPLEQKVFKSLELVGTPSVGWGTAISSNLQSGYTTDFSEMTTSSEGVGPSATFKEGHAFSTILSPPVVGNILFGALVFVIGNGSITLGEQYLAQRSINAVAQYATADTENTVGATWRVNFALGIELGSIVVGDRAMAMYTDGSDNGFFCGIVTYRGDNIDVASPFLGQPCIEVDTTGGFNPTQGAPASPERYLIYIKNQNYESYGMLGDYAQVTLSLTTPGAVELFSVNSDVMKSFP